MGWTASFDSGTIARNRIEMRGDMEATFEVGEKAVYPAQGVAEVTGIETKEISGNQEQFYMLRVLDSAKKIMIPVPTIIMKITTLLFSWLKILPVSYDQIVMLEQGNTADPKTLTELIGRELKNFNPETLKYLNN